MWCWIRNSCEPVAVDVRRLGADVAVSPSVSLPRLLRCSVWLAAVANLSAAERLIWHDTPATHFTESVPLGNGRLGAMVFGGVTVRADGTARMLAPPRRP
jgi:hypothetical protein